MATFFRGFWSLGKAHFERSEKMCHAQWLRGKMASGEPSEPSEAGELDVHGLLEAMDCFNTFPSRKCKSDLDSELGFQMNHQIFVFFKQKVVSTALNNYIVFSFFSFFGPLRSASSPSTSLPSPSSVWRCWQRCAGGAWCGTWSAWRSRADRFLETTGCMAFFKRLPFKRLLCGWPFRWLLCGWPFRCLLWLPFNMRFCLMFFGTYKASKKHPHTDLELLKSFLGLKTWHQLKQTFFRFSPVGLYLLGSTP